MIPDCTKINLTLFWIRKSIVYLQYSCRLSYYTSKKTSRCFRPPVSAWVQISHLWASAVFTPISNFPTQLFLALIFMFRTFIFTRLEPYRIALSAQSQRSGGSRDLLLCRGTRVFLTSRGLASFGIRRIGSCTSFIFDHPVVVHHFSSGQRARVGHRGPTRFA